MTHVDRSFLERLRRELESGGSDRTAKEQRHPARNNPKYGAFKSDAAAEVDALCERLVRDLRSSITEIDRTIGPIAGPLDDQLARGAVSDIFEAAAEVLKMQIRGGGDSSS